MSKRVVNNNIVCARKHRSFHYGFTICVNYFVAVIPSIIKVLELSCKVEYTIYTKHA